jgi:hypothetical protein
MKQNIREKAKMNPNQMSLGQNEAKYKRKGQDEPKLKSD